MDQSMMDNAARSPLSPKEGTWSMPLSRDLISEQIRKCWSPTLGKSSREKSSRNRTWPTRHHSKSGKRHEREDVGENLSFRNQRQRVKPALPTRRAAAVSNRPTYQKDLLSVKSHAGFRVLAGALHLCLGEHHGSRN